MTMTETIRADLVARLAELEARASAIETELREPLAADSEEQATEMEDDEALAGIENVALREIAAIRAAIARIDAGRYGQCVTCGEDIAPARLEAQPEATLCIACASEREQ